MVFKHISRYQYPFAIAMTGWIMVNLLTVRTGFAGTVTQLAQIIMVAIEEIIFILWLYSEREHWGVGGQIFFILYIATGIVALISFLL